MTTTISYDELQYRAEIADTKRALREMGKTIEEVNAAAEGIAKDRGIEVDWPMDAEVEGQ